MSNKLFDKLGITPVGKRVLSFFDVTGQRILAYYDPDEVNELKNQRDEMLQGYTKIMEVINKLNLGEITEKMGTTLISVIVESELSGITGKTWEELTELLNER